MIVRANHTVVLFIKLLSARFLLTSAAFVCVLLPLASVCQSSFCICIYPALPLLTSRRAVCSLMFSFASLYAMHPNPNPNYVGLYVSVRRNYFPTPVEIVREQEMIRRAQKGKRQPTVAKIEMAGEAQPAGSITVVCVCYGLAFYSSCDYVRSSLEVHHVVLNRIPDAHHACFRSVLCLVPQS